MTQQHDTTGELRAAFTMRMIEDAKHNLQPERGAVGVFMRVTLAVIFMFLVVISYTALGTAGLVSVSALFLLALFSPYFYQTLKGLLAKNRAQRDTSISEWEARQEG